MTRSTVRRRSGLAVVFALTVALLTSGCASGGGDAWTDDDWTGDPDAPVVLTTFTVLADMARAVGGDHVQVRSITKVGAEIHGYEPTPLDIAKASEADLILDNGLGLESWFAKFVDQTDVPHVVVSEGIDPIDITGDAYAGKPNPHAWMSPRNAQIYVTNMVDAFTSLDPDNAAEYAKNGAAYQKQLRSIEDRLAGAVEQLPESHRALVTCEGAFSYLARDAGLTEQYIWPVNAEQQATPQQIADTIEFVRGKEVPAVFCESTVSDRPMQQVAESSGAAFGGTLYVDSLSEPDGPVPSYLDLLTYDADTIVAALSGSGSGDAQ